MTWVLWADGMLNAFTLTPLVPRHSPARVNSGSTQLTELRLNMWSATFVTGSAHRPRSGCDHPTAASSIVSRDDSEEFPFLPHPARVQTPTGTTGSPTAAARHAEALVRTRVAGPALQSPPSCPSGLLRCREHTDPSARKSRAPHGLQDHFIPEGLLEGLGTSHAHMENSYSCSYENLLSARGC